MLVALDRGQDSNFDRGGSGRGRGGRQAGSFGNMGPPSTPSYAGQPTRTPNPYNGGKTPGWTRTPNPYAGDGGKTPAAWSTAARTTNPYADEPFLTDTYFYIGNREGKASGNKRVMKLNGKSAYSYVR